jgi:hypothetical protein
MNYVFEMFFGCFVECGVDSFEMFVSYGIGDLQAEGLAAFLVSLYVEVALGKADVGMRGGVECDIVGCGDAAVDREDFPAEDFVLDDFDNTCFLDLFEVEYLEEFKVVDQIVMTAALHDYIFKFELQINKAVIFFSSVTLD